LLDVSFRSNKPGSILVYADGADARLLRKLLSVLGSEERVQNALILTGLLSKLEKKTGTADAVRAKKVRECFEGLVGVSFQEFQRLIEN
jgi:hypothetical protein